MTTANELGVIESKFENSSPINIGDRLELSATPSFETTGDGLEVVKLPTVEGLRYSFSKVVIGQMRSTNPKSVGGVLATALSKKTTLTVWVVEKVANTDRKGVSLSLFEPRNSN